MSETNALDASIRSIIREVVREEIRAALDDRARAARNAIPSDSDATYLSLSRAASIADVAPGTLRRWIKAGRLPVRRAGRVYRVARADLDDFLRTGRTADVVHNARSILGVTR